MNQNMTSIENSTRFLNSTALVSYAMLSLIVITGYQGEARTISSRRLRVRKVSATDGYASPIQRTDHRSRSF